MGAGVSRRQPHEQKGSPAVPSLEVGAPSREEPARPEHPPSYYVLLPVDGSFESCEECGGRLLRCECVGARGYENVHPLHAGNPDPPAQAPDTLRVVCVSDTHGMHDHFKHLPMGDVLVHAGDFSMLGKQEEIESLARWLKELPHRYKIIIAGNHDLTFHEGEYENTLWARFHERRGLGPYDVEHLRELLINGKENDESLELEGVRFYGSPWQPEFCGWAFNLKRGEEIRAVWKKIPDEVDVLITHGPPHGHGDGTYDGSSVGCADLLREIDSRVRPKVHVFGHVHEGYGASTNDETVFINASSCNLGYEKDHLQPAIVFDIPKRDTGDT